MNDLLSRLPGSPSGQLGWILLTCLLASTTSLQAQARRMVPQTPIDLPPGAVGQAQLSRGGPIAGYFQPVEVQPPGAVELAAAAEGRFMSSRPGPLKAGMLIGAVYRLRVTNIPGHVGKELFPSIEVIDRLYPPSGRVAEFPIPIVLTEKELLQALKGTFITRVIYLEDPRQAFPAPEIPGQQLTYDVPSHLNPVDLADQLGRPVAILRLGSRILQFDQVSRRFLFDSPPLRFFPAAKEIPAAAIEKLPHIPRVRLSRPLHTVPLQR